MKKIFSLLLVMILTISLVGCENNTSYYESDETESTYAEEKSDIDSNEEPIVDKKEEIEYYSFLTKKGNGLVFNISIDEFLDNYNLLKSPYEDYDYKDICSTDFFYIESGANYNGTNVDVYGCTLSIMGKNNDICIMISKDSNNNNITALSLGVQNFNLYTGDARTKILVQYRLLIQALGISETTAQSYINEMANNLKDYNIFATYDDGLALYLDTSNSHADYYRINPYTKEQWESAPGLNQISIR